MWEPSSSRPYFSLSALTSLLTLGVYTGLYSEAHLCHRVSPVLSHREQLQGLQERPSSAEMSGFKIMVWKERAQHSFPDLAYWGLRSLLVTLNVTFQPVSNHVNAHGAQHLVTELNLWPVQAWTENGTDIDLPIFLMLFSSKNFTNKLLKHIMRVDPEYVTIQNAVPLLQPHLQLELIPTSAIHWCRWQHRSQFAQLDLQWVFTRS